MFVFAGLGNPGPNYARNRHNVGFLLADEIAALYGFSPFAPKFGGKLAEGRIGSQRVLAFKPLGYMNLSGGPLLQLMQFYKVPLNHLCVLHDELDLPLGKIRVKSGGGNGGHNGLKSIDETLGPDYRRVRIGIGRPEDKDRVADYVLSDFMPDEMNRLEHLAKAMTKHLPLLIEGNEAEFMNKVTLATGG